MLAWTPASGAYVSSTHSALYPVPSARVVGTSGPRGPVVVPRVVTSMGVASTLGSNTSRAPPSGIKVIAAPPPTSSADGHRSATPPQVVRRRDEGGDPAQADRLGTRLHGRFAVVRAHDPQTQVAVELHGPAVLLADHQVAIGRVDLRRAPGAERGA